MKENLKVTKKPTGEAVTRYCYKNNLKICNTDGGLYSWNTTMNNSIEEGARGICPSDFHVPTDIELKNLVESQATAGCESVSGVDCAPAGIKLKLGGSSGFNVVFAGDRTDIGSFIDRGVEAHLWSSTEFGYFAWSRILYSGLSSVYREWENKAFGFSVRCLKN